MKSKLERWVQFHDCLVGYMFDNKYIKPGTRVITKKIIFIDPTNFEAECLDGKYKLGEPGTQEEHNKPLLGS